ncbi:MAG: hypothetical protein IBX62_10035 [Coriobacteriia bacterium]|nr:hypothetical protein [Coriobacteriia bacterium]
MNPIIAVASSEAVGPEARLKLPVEHKELLARPADTFTGRTTATLNLGLIDPFLGGRVRVEDYDAVLTSAEVKALRADPRLVGLPMDVWALRAVGRGPVVRLYTDTARMGIFIVPDGELPGEGR